MATNEPTLIGMLLRPQSAAVQNSTQARADASRDAQLFSESLNTAYRDQRSTRPDRPVRSDRPEPRPDNSNQRLSANDNKQDVQLEARAKANERAADLASARTARSEPQDRLNVRQQETLERLEPAQRETVEALPLAKQAEVLDELADSAENGLGDNSLGAILEQLDPPLREQLMELMQSLSDQAVAGADPAALLTQIEQASEAGQIPPELATWLSDQLKAGAKTAGLSAAQSADALAGRLDAMQASLKQALATNSGGVQVTPGTSIGKDSSAALGLTEPAQGQPMDMQSGFAKSAPLSLDGQREQGALLETAKLHNLLAGRTESTERPTAGSITALTESLGLASRTLATPAAPRVASQVLPGFNQPGWGDAVGQKVLWMVKQNITSADMRLDPPDLGLIHVRVTIQNDQAHVSFSSAQPVVREALDQHSARLREMLTEQGMTSVDVDVSDQRSFAESDSRAGGEEGSQHSGGSLTGSANTLDDAELDVANNTSQLGVVSLIDHYA